MMLNSLLSIAILLLIIFISKDAIERRLLDLLPEPKILRTWADLAGQLNPVPLENIFALAQDYLQPTGLVVARTNTEVWRMLEGAKGLARMKKNAQILIALASYAQRWNPEDGTIVAERMRHDGLNLARAVLNLSLAMTCGYGKARVIAYATEAAGSYQLMRQRLLTLYKNNHGGIYPVLADSV